VADSVTRCVATGVAGLSIEDATGDSSSPLYDLPIAAERVRAARHAIDQSGEDVLLTARAECYHVGHPDPFRESVRRLQAYVAAGADVLFAPGPQTSAEIEALVAAVAPRPLNLLVVRNIGLRVEEIAALGVRRISVGGALALAGWTGFMRAAQALRSEGSFAEELALEHLARDALQLTRTHGRCDRRLRSWISRARSSLPVPDSPVIRTVASDDATSSTCSKTWRSERLRPTIRPKLKALSISSFE
jgi:2-methylisocitrate lyase-like PEP mutase family enzyme